MGGAVKVVMRGNRSVAGNNQPLYVIDGVPMLNESSEQPYTAIGGTADAGNRDAGDGISNLNPEDIESISILKGAPLRDTGCQRGYFDYYEEGIGRETRGCFHFQCGF